MPYAGQEGLSLGLTALGTLSRKLTQLDTQGPELWLVPSAPVSLAWTQTTLLSGLFCVSSIAHSPMFWGAF